MIDKGAATTGDEKYLKNLEAVLVDQSLTIGDLKLFYRMTGEQRCKRIHNLPNLIKLKKN